MIYPENRRCNPDRSTQKRAEKDLHSAKLPPAPVNGPQVCGHPDDGVIAKALFSKSLISRPFISKPLISRPFISKPKAPDNLWLNIFRIQKSAGYLCPLRLHVKAVLKHLISSVCIGALALSTQIQAQTQAEVSAKPLSGSGMLTTKQLKQQCQPLMEGSQSLMSAFQSGQCSSYILGIYDLVAQQCPRLSISRDDAVRSTLVHLSGIADNHAAKDAPAVRTIDQFLSNQSQCLPVASL